MAASRLIKLLISLLMPLIREHLKKAFFSFVAWFEEILERRRDAQDESAANAESKAQASEKMAMDRL
jgi:hypothetical protein